MSEHRRVLDHFHKRLLAAVSRSSLLKATVARTGRLLDCSRLEVVQNGLGGRLVRGVLEGEKDISVELRLRFRGTNVSEYSDAEDEERQDSPDDRIVREHRAIFDALDRRMRRFAELVKRETGVHSLWLGYPLLYVVVGEDDAQQWILAPVFLWPVAIRLDSRREGRVWIGREAGPVKFNRAMASWVERQLHFDLRAPGEEELDRMTWSDFKQHVNSLAHQFHDPPIANCDAPLEPIPNAKLLSPQQSPRLFNSAALGIFRWQNEAILADLEKLKQRDEVGGIASAFTSGVPLPHPPPVQRPPEADRYQVYDADFSQERVIWQARSEPGLVVHGPPGTGKSQTIVNVIADALAHGRTVLMVCQKYAATHIVLEKLKQVGLEELCLEVTDTERSRLPVFRAIRDQVDSLPANAEFSSSTRRERLARDITRLEEELDQYAHALYARDEGVHLSYREMKNIEGVVYNRFPTVRPLAELQSRVMAMPTEELEALRPQIEGAGRLYGLATPLTNPWRFHQPALQLTAASEADIRSVIRQLRELDLRHLAQVQKSGAGVHIGGELAAFNDIATRLLPRIRDVARNPRSDRAQLLRTWIQQLRETNPDASNRFRGICERAVALAERLAAAPLDPELHERCEGMSDAELATLGKQARAVLANEGRWWRFLSVRFHSARKAVCEYRSNPDGATVWETARNIGSYEVARKLRSELAAVNQRLVPKLRPLTGESSQMRYPALALDELNWADWLCRNQCLHPWLTDLIAELEGNPDVDLLEQTAQRLEQSLQRLGQADALLKELLSLLTYLQKEALVEPEELVRRGWTILPWLEQLESGLEVFQSLVAWNLQRQHYSEPLRSIITALEEYERRRHEGERVPMAPVDLPLANYGEWWGALVRYSATLAWQHAFHQRYPVLVAMTPEMQAEKVRELQTLIAQKRDLEAESIRSYWLERQIARRNAPWKRMFQLKKGKLGNSKRLREAVSLSLAEGLLALRPCWLVNPGTAAEIFPLERGLFDLVIFDEASQCPIEQAVPAIYRGKSLIVSGDEKQLPPTGFWKTGWIAGQSNDDDDDDEASDVVVSRDDHLRRVGVAFLLEVEDLLGAAIGSLPECYLSVHYRSRHPALIEFSNRAFYSGRLEAPPSRLSTVNGFCPIQYHEVGGLYERRTNVDEAKLVVRLLKDIWMTDGSSPTIGVVTFNQPQRDLIENLLEEECLRDQAFRARYQEEFSRDDDNQDVGFFVKNLENVQGDERDVMIFSTTFGRDTTGRFYRRFGPVGTAGGERRLNVAVTRAKQQVIVVGSMPIHEISMALSAELAPGTQLTPACYLQLYLAYAKAVSERDEDRIHHILERAGHKSPTMTTADTESPFEEDVREVVERLGFTVHSQIGDCGFRIDLGVLARDPRQGYILGIECDGATYHSDRSARLRDVWRAQILRGRGWYLHRIWSTRWWYHRGDEIERLKVVLDEAESHLEHSIAKAPVSARPESSRDEIRESWQMTLTDWKQLRDKLRDRGDENALRAIGGLGTDFQHRYRVQEALRQGKAVPKEVLDDYPDLLAARDLSQRELFDD